ncbi:MAG: hypothetical protein K0Q87_83 [Neobacillus sp.]|jgi:hypothetical protein|nr:hypothetical protein [Neobacillus sp.]
MFQKLESFTKDVSDLANQPVLSAEAMKGQFDAAPNEVREYLNKLVDALKKTEEGDSGAKNIGASAITGLTGTDIQTIMESLKTYTETYNGKIQKGRVSFTVPAGANATQTVSFPKAFTNDPEVAVTHNGTATPDKYGLVSVSSVTKTNFKLTGYNGGTSAVVLYYSWIAVD